MTDIDYAARVAKGAALLDAERPGWERELDLSTLNIANGETCVTAQLSGVNRWWAGMTQLGLTEGTGGTYISHGFNAESGEDKDLTEGYDQQAAYATLNTLWRELITARLAASEEGPA